MNEDQPDEDQPGQPDVVGLLVADGAADDGGAVDGPGNADEQAQPDPGRRQERVELPGHLPELIKSIEPAVIAAHGKHPSDLVAQATEENVRLNVKRLIDDSPIMSEALAAKQIAVSGGLYDIATGKVKLI